MSLISWERFADTDPLLSRLMPPGFIRWPQFFRQNASGKFQWSPAADISETSQEYLIRAELPGIKKKDVHVTFDDGMIKIKGERKQRKEDQNEKHRRIESFYGSFERSFAVPKNINADLIRCDSKDGILTVHIPRTQTQAPEPKQISVQ
jgi:HSP20 family protein